MFSPIKKPVHECGRCQTRVGCGICFLTSRVQQHHLTVIWRLHLMSVFHCCLKTFCANYFLQIYFSDSPAVVMIRSSGLVKEEFGAGKQCRRKQESLRPQTSTIPANHWRFRKFSNTTKPTGSLALLMDGCYSSSEAAPRMRMFNFTTYRTHALWKKKRHMIQYHCGKRARCATNLSSWPL